ncbi:WAP four-disulfide core domain protein 2 [Zootermopsis nevadensis]|uniref:WAP four-disulfide core domain protein 2 n=2 Tax=Zootermopsis nevadensis TaxID=136037 RepID=A0A067QSE3_ZOONE|nr:WAP four-disulfide core domain protein 2 [Zootermopsis nevadensis]
MGRVTSAISLLLLFAISCVVAQQDAKPGACPPPVAVGICDMKCFSDNDCEGSNKCCRTGCGGTVCTISVTARDHVTRAKPGRCPEKPTGPWVCSSACRIDGDCRGRSKCCQNRCGAFACTKPES